MEILRKLSTGIARIEVLIGAALGAVTTALILLNVVTRSFAKALFWVDEAAITSMVWMTFLGASAAIHHRQSVAVTFVPDMLRGPVARALLIATDLAVLVFFCVLFALAWNWFDPITLARHGFDTGAFSGATFNFIYSEVSTTLGVPKFWLWLIVPIFAFGASVHALNNLAQTAYGGPETGPLGSDREVA
ncbi:TRAP transporter - DctQ subunit (plasmid) [Dinoroseobacter shibae DFL 12 = DSM 16493]|jgi:TRAP-type C4-dicarboxylate transport system permease small subunit|uniref:TRAP transporter small permease protein n=1 Tax=Dinoroseobacter shibae (strain DSM 16493 / NCIMB 14021 / DFL 12) TaxID=398580 RepID=A8LT74_DINSH|nr:TRAP transporter small permease [Dinoroseobacter shibae]ABV95441.1 TRAP transporter - DctQ subunit [Dinoroseobacter shibae DFL 12 = DSM 16493]URF48633.1 TRAP transporter small permease [Dinoroseobacter shibae]URF52945.1 TRAP transporter small permease [Dinoroseobacter shibae]